MNWYKKEISPDQVKDIAGRYGCDLLVASILVRRGITKGEDIRYFLESDVRHLRNPFQLSGMEDAVERILAAKDEGEKVLVFGDRDVDGITSTSLLVRHLEKMGIDVRWQVPLGDDAYGLSKEAVEQFAADYGTLIITVDCGISNIEEISRAREFGIDVIVVDHHNPQDVLPEAFAIINPKLKESPYPFRDLCGCGVTYKLVSALRFAQKSELYGQNICLLTTRPTNDAFVVEAVHLRNLVEQSRLTETIIPGMVQLEQTRLLPFLKDQQILTWDAPLQKKAFAKMFGPAVEVYMLDVAPEIAKVLPAVAGKSLLRIKELSRIAKYSDKSPSELDVFINLFVSFIQKREAWYGEEDQQDLQLAALGTIADLMPLKDENRIIVRAGLAAMEAKARPGVSDLLFKQGLAGRHLNASDLAWQLCPVINAAGRMGKPDRAVQLLLEDNPSERERLANEILEMNENRKKLGSEIWNIVEPMAQASMEVYSNKLAIAFGPEIHRGVTGIMASKMVNRFKVPSLVVAFNGEHTVTGSLRSSRGYDLRSLLDQCADLFLDWGGHDFAAGFSMLKQNWEAFLERLKLVAATMELEDSEDEELVQIDAELPLKYMTGDLLNIVDLFEPYGEENNPLIFLAKNLKIIDISLMGKNEAKHVKLTIDAGTYKWPAVYWQAAEKVKRDFDLNDTVDMVFRINRNYFNGNETPQLIITDIKRSGTWEQNSPQ
ncbi:single-stranded-DNA-specific exonuclease RecJ [Gracilinema caldarium]|uniref:single-stranded-DNA-specific exonuclease RecJ n=1 Tax=Gracilinema caldarium TaxID=215591 RepID=UPI0026F12276|nr:single-stranded-DNA-specific exonuclease RecJ [Gracilinema caldarium]